MSDWTWGRIHLWPLVLISTRGVHLGLHLELWPSCYQRLMNSTSSPELWFSWAWRGQCIQEGQNTNLFCAFSKKVVLQTFTNVASSWTERSLPVLGVGQQTRAAYVHLYANIFLFKCLSWWKSTSLVVVLAPVRNGSTGQQFSFWLSSGVVELWYPPGGAGDAGPGYTSWLIVHCPCLHPHHCCVCPVMTLHQLHHVGLNRSTRAAGQVDLVEILALSQAFNDHRHLTYLHW